MSEMRYDSQKIIIDLPLTVSFTTGTLLPCLRNSQFPYKIIFNEDFTPPKQIQKNIKNTYEFFFLQKRYYTLPESQKTKYKTHSVNFLSQPV